MPPPRGQRFVNGEKVDEVDMQRTHTTYYDWLLDRAFVFVPAQSYVGKFLETFREFPPRQKAASAEGPPYAATSPRCGRD